MLAKNETAAVSAPVRSRSKIIADQMRAMPIRPVAVDPVQSAPVAPTKPRMTLAEFQAANTNLPVELIGVSAPVAVAAAELPNAELGGMSEADLIRKLAAYDDLKMRAKKLYEESDVLEGEIFEAMRPGDIVLLADGRRATMVDNLDGFDKRTGKPKNKIWKIAGASRFELEFTKAGK